MARPLLPQRKPRWLAGLVSKSGGVGGPQPGSANFSSGTPSPPVCSPKVLDILRHFVSFWTTCTPWCPSPLISDRRQGFRWGVWAPKKRSRDWVFHGRFTRTWKQKQSLHRSWPFWMLCWFIPSCFFQQTWTKRVKRARDATAPVTFKQHPLPFPLRPAPARSSVFRVAWLVATSSS